MPILDPHTVEFFSRSPEQTRRIGARLGSLLQPADIVCLSGELGTGKTTFVQGVAQGWGSYDRVSSPTFVLENIYRRPDGQTLHHLDAYRLNGATEAEELDVDMMTLDGPLVVEWPERIRNVLPESCLWVDLRWVADEQRGMIFTPHGSRYEKLVDQFRRRVFGG